MCRIATILLVTLLFLTSCKKEDTLHLENISDRTIIKAIDASFIIELRKLNVKTFNKDAIETDFLTTLSNSGFNTIRLRLWHSPSTSNSSFDEVKSFANEIKNKGMSVWLTVHYSDTWADPGKQTKPNQWMNISHEALKDSVYQYTSMIATEIKPDYIQIGNEINNGFLWPEGNLNNFNQFKELLSVGIGAVRNSSPKTKIMLHHAGHTDALHFLSDLSSLDYDIIALSYYPYWHGKDLILLKNNLNQIVAQLDKDIVIAETTYPFASLVGTSGFLVPEYPATPNGQRDFIKHIYQLMLDNPKGIGIGIWGGVTEAYKIPKPTPNGYYWENQAMLDYDNIPLPVLEIFL